MSSEESPSVEVGNEARRERLRILFILLEVPETNSPYSELAMGFVNRHDVGLCSFFEPAIAVHPGIRVFSGNQTFRGFFRALDSALAATAWDVVHVHTPHVGILFLLKTAFRPGLRRRMVITVHNAYQNHKFRNKLLLLPNMACAYRVVCCGRAAAESFPLPYRWIAGRRFTFVANGVNAGRIARVRHNAPAKSEAQGFEVVSASRLVPIKNLPTALRAYHRAQVGASHLSFIGDGPETAKLRLYVEEHDLDDVVGFTGLITRDEVFERFLRADLFLSTSYGEGLPVAALEAMACGCPVLLSDVPPHREITDGLDFIHLVSPDDVEGFAREIARFREMSPSEREAIGQACRRHVEANFGLPTMLAGYERVYHEVIDAAHEKVRGVEPASTR